MMNILLGIITIYCGVHVENAVKFKEGLHH